MRNLVVLLLIGVAAVGCASDEPPVKKVTAIADGAIATASVNDSTASHAVGAGAEVTATEAAVRAVIHAAANK